ncbi:MAG: IS1096 element passenger TnpR family protein [bacterium]
MAKSTTDGQCLFCKGTFSKQAMSKHLDACEKRKSSKKASASPQRAFHLLVEGRYAPEYWIHLEAAANATLQDFDGLLRNLWLECCGHLSAFTIAGQTYSSTVMDEFGDKNMRVPLGKVLYPKMKFNYEYDFGTTTELTLKVVAERESAIKRGDIMLMARNDQPFYPCNECGENATQVCCQCVYEGEGWVCDDCAEDHECGEEMLLPVVNSPRVGMCAYAG